MSSLDHRLDKIDQQLLELIPKGLSQPPGGRAGRVGTATAQPATGSRSGAG
jgi:hypothetical protein